MAPAPSYDPSLHRLLPADIRRSGTLAVATDATYPPASFFAPDGRTVIGFEPDLAAALAAALGAVLGAVLGLRVEFVVTDFIHTLPDVRAGRADVGTSRSCVTPYRRRSSASAAPVTTRGSCGPGTSRKARSRPSASTPAEHQRPGRGEVQAR